MRKERKNIGFLQISIPAPNFQEITNSLKEDWKSDYWLVCSSFINFFKIFFLEEAQIFFIFSRSRISKRNLKGYDLISNFFWTSNSLHFNFSRSSYLLLNNHSILRWFSNLLFLIEIKSRKNSRFKNLWQKSKDFWGWREEYSLKNRFEKNLPIWTIANLSKKNRFLQIFWRIESLGHSFLKFLFYKSSQWRKLKFNRTGLKKEGGFLNPFLRRTFAMKELLKAEKPPGNFLFQGNQFLHLQDTFNRRVNFFSLDIFFEFYFHKKLLYF